MLLAILKIVVLLMIIIIPLRPKKKKRKHNPKIILENHSNTHDSHYAINENGVIEEIKT